MVLSRKPSMQELKLIRFLVQKAELELELGWDKKLIVTQLNDDGMGSLRLEPQGLIRTNRKLESRVSEHIFKDTDGVDVIASLNLDTNKELFELDLWKTDFSPLLSFPEDY